MNENENNNTLARLEALLFVHGEPLSVAKIATLLALEEEIVHASIKELEQQYADESRGIQLVTGSGKVQLVTKPEFSGLVEAFAKEQLSEDLTPASLEALAIVCYFGPISRSRIEYLRGVNSAVTLRNLALRGLVEKVSDAQHGTLYRGSFDLMKHLGVQSMDGLPDFAQFQALFIKAQQIASSADTPPPDAAS